MNLVINKIKAYLFRILLFTAIMGIGLALTGAVSREHNVLTMEECQDTKIDSLVKKYQPTLISSKNGKQEDLEVVYYEVVKIPDGYAINYHFVWSQRNHPEMLKNFFYKAYDFFNFKFQLVDVEYVQCLVGVDSAEWQYGVERSSSKLKPTLVPSNWDHDLKNIENSNEISSEEIAYTPEYLSNENYVGLKIARRDHGDFHTPDNTSNYPIILFLALLTTFYFRHLQNDYGRN